MKKTKILMPILTVGAVATTFAPMVACSKKNNVIDIVLNFNEQMFDNDPGMVSEKMNFDKNKEYHATFDLALSHGEFDLDEASTFALVTNFDLDKDTFKIGIADATVSVDGSTLQKVNSDEPEKGQFSIRKMDADTKEMILFGGETFNDDSKVEINFTINADGESFAAFIPMK